MKRTYPTAALIAGLASLSPTAFAQTSDWSGFSIGINAGQGMRDDNGGETVVFDTNRDGTFDDTVRTGLGADAFSPGFCNGAAIGATAAEGCRTSGDDNINYGLKVGYDWQFGNFVVGALAEYTVVNLGDDVSAFSTTPASYTFTRDLNGVTAVRGRAGYAFGTSLLYATGGMAWGDMAQSFTTTNTANSFTRTGGSDVHGYQLGVGYELMLDPGMMGPGWSLGIEYLMTSLDDSDYQVAVSQGTAPATNPFLLVDPSGTDMRRTNEDFEYSVIGATLNWRW